MKKAIIILGVGISVLCNILISCQKEDIYLSYENEDTYDNLNEEINSEERTIYHIDIPNFDVTGVSYFVKDQIEDTINHTSWKYCLLLPPSYYENEQKKYPVLYLLHGLGSAYTDWVGAGNSQLGYDYCLFNDLMPEVIVVMPSGGESYYVDGYEGKDLKYETFFFKEFIPEVESKYRIDRRYSCRMIAGCSMGGYGAAHYAFKYNDMFSYCYAMSGTLLGKGDGTTPSILEEVEKKNPNSLPLMTMDIGLGDGFLEINEFVNRKLDLAGVPHEFIIRNGQHSWSYWKESIYLLYVRVGKVLNGNIDFIN